jgi:hypothetical protein
MKKVDWTICPNCKKREREICSHDGQMEMYCGYCADKLYEDYKERVEFGLDLMRKERSRDCY